MYHFFQVVVLLVGTNNICNTPEEVSDGIVEIVKASKVKLPEAYIVVIVRLFMFVFFIVSGFRV